MFSLFSRKGAAKSRDFEDCALGLQYLRALHKFELQAFTCYSVGLLIKSRRLHLSCKSRKYSTNWVRLSKIAILERAKKFGVLAFLGKLMPAKCRDIQGKIERREADGESV